MKLLSWVLSALLVPVSLSAQEPLYHEAFDTPEVRQLDEKMLEEMVRKYFFQPRYAAGINGLALDLSEDTPIRRPVVVPSDRTPDYSRVFSFSVWVRTKPGARQGTPIMGNKKQIDSQPQVHNEYLCVLRSNAENEGAKPGWLLGTTDAGGWYFYINDGKLPYIYNPTVERQRINDGRWHLLSGSVDLLTKDLWLYFDGRNVAVYNIETIETAVTSQATVIGGVDEYVGHGLNTSEREWVAFNGYVDEAKLWNRAITPKEVSDEYGRYFPQSPDPMMQVPPTELKVQTWNILHGGRRLGEHVGVKRVAEVLAGERADIIGLVETYGSGAALADSLGYYYYLIGDNLSILSRFPIVSTVKLYKSFRFGGAVLDVGGGKQVTFLDVWLDYRGYERQKEDVAGLKSGLKKLVKESKTPVFAVGDFNIRTHLDFSPGDDWYSPDMERSDYSSRFMASLGFRDSYRVAFPNVRKNPGYTFSPALYGIQRTARLKRIDFIYYHGDGIIPFHSQVISHHPVFWPSDHSSVVTWFQMHW